MNMMRKYMNNIHNYKQCRAWHGLQFNMMIILSYIGLMEDLMEVDKSAQQHLVPVYL